MNGVARQVTGNLEALAALSLILASRLKFQGELAGKKAEKCHSVLLNCHDRMQSNEEAGQMEEVQGECWFCQGDKVGTHAPVPQILDLAHL